jgi:hypothetical protein
MCQETLTTGYSAYFALSLNKEWGIINKIVERRSNETLLQNMEWVY